MEMENPPEAYSEAIRGLRLEPLVSRAVSSLPRSRWASRCWQGAPTQA